MLSLDPNDPIKMNLEQIRTAIASIAGNSIKIIFRKECYINNDWQITERLNGDFAHNICLGCGNHNFQAIAVIGSEDSAINDLIGTVNGPEILDAFGETLNTFFAMLMDNKNFIGYFGILTQAIAQYSADINFYPKAWGCNGTLITPEKNQMYFGFAIKNHQKQSL